MLVADSRYHIDIQQYKVRSANLPKEFDGFRIAQLSDLHKATFGKDNVRLVRAVSKTRPDLIALTGDFIENEKQLYRLKTLLLSLTQIAPVYFINGNHDWYSGKIPELTRILKETGVTYLRNEYVHIYKNGAHILLCGAEDPHGVTNAMQKPDALIHKIRQMHPQDYLLLLGHRNDWTIKYPHLDVDTILCGHAHGGIIRLPLIGGLAGTNLKPFPDIIGECTNGIYSTDRYHMVVSRGLGNTSPLILPRLLNRVHLPLIILKHKY